MLMQCCDATRLRSFEEASQRRPPRSGWAFFGKAELLLGLSGSGSRSRLAVRLVDACDLRSTLVARTRRRRCDVVSEPRSQAEVIGLQVGSSKVPSAQGWSENLTKSGHLTPRGQFRQSV